MQLSDIYLDLGQEAFTKLVRGISIGKLRTYQIYEGFKVGARLAKVNTESLKKAVPRFWARISERDEEFARELAQATLLSHIDMIVAVLDFLGVPHENGFFAKDLNAKPYFGDGWEARIYGHFHESFPDPILSFYINHLRWELLSAEQPWHPDSIAA